MSPAGYFLLFVLIGLAVALVARALSNARGGAASSPARAGAPPGCGACGYDTTGLASLTCPECGADLRVAGITRGPTKGAARAFAGALGQFLAAWLFCGAVLWAVVVDLHPVRHAHEYEIRFTGPSSGKYAAVVVRAHSTALGRSTPTVAVRIDLEPNAPPGGAAPPPPPPLVIDPRGGGYEYAGAAGNRVRHPSGFDAEAVLGWLAAAGVDTTDRRTRDEAQQVWLAALRAGRMRRYDPETGGAIGASTVTGMGRAFTTTRISERNLPTPARVGLFAFVAFWLVLFFLGLAYLSRATWRPRVSAAPAPA